MARFEFKLPDIGEGVAEGEIVAWHVKPGDSVKEDQPMVDVMTDKANVTIGAPKKGTILETLAKVGDVVPVGSLLVVIEVEGAAAPRSESHAGSASMPSSVPSAAPSPSSMPSSAARRSEGPAATAVGDLRDTVPGAHAFANKDTSSPSTATVSSAAAAPASISREHPASKHGASARLRSDRHGDDGYFTERPLATPAVRKLARDLGVDLRRVRPSGEGGRVTLDDVRALADLPPTAHEPVPAASEPQPTARAPVSRPPVALASPAGTAPTLEERKPFVGVRRKIAERMQQSKQTAAHFTFVEECDVGPLKGLRKRMQPLAEARGVKLTFLPFIVKAVVAALQKHPILNSALDESTNELVYRRYYHIGIAASTDQGLMVPVVKDADRKSILEIAREIDRLGTAAKTGTIAASELVGSTFTITSLGAQGGLFATPVLNFPEVGILGVHQIKRKPVVRGDEIVIGEIMLLSLSFDHRIVDGHVGAAFAYDIIAALENPDLLFLDMS